MYNKLKTDEIIEICNKFGLEWIDGEYQNIYSKIKCKDKYGYLYQPTLNGLILDKMLDKLNKNNIYSLHNLKLYFKIHHPDIELRTDKYEDYDMKLDCRCRICNHEWNPMFNSIKVGKGCPNCANRERNGALSVTLARRNKNKWTNRKAKIYIIKCLKYFIK